LHRGVDRYRFLAFGKTIAGAAAAVAVSSLDTMPGLGCSFFFFIAFRLSDKIRHPSAPMNKKSGQHYADRFV